jgi:hypothetical protein
MKTLNAEYDRKQCVAKDLADQAYLADGLRGMEDELAFLRGSNADPVVLAEFERLYRNQVRHNAALEGK